MFHINRDADYLDQGGPLRGVLQIEVGGVGGGGGGGGGGGSRTGHKLYTQLHTSPNLYTHNTKTTITLTPKSTYIPSA